MPAPDATPETFVVPDQLELVERLNKLHLARVGREAITDKLYDLADTEHTPEIFVLNVFRRLATFETGEERLSQRPPSYVPHIIGLLIKNDPHRSRAWTFWDELKVTFDIDTSPLPKPEPSPPKTKDQRRAKWILDGVIDLDRVPPSQKPKPRKIQKRDKKRQKTHRKLSDHERIRQRSYKLDTEKRKQRDELPPPRKPEENKDD